MYKYSSPLLVLLVMLQTLAYSNDSAAPSTSSFLPVMPPQSVFLRIAENSPFSTQSATSGDIDQSFGWNLSGLLNIAGKQYAILKNLETSEQIYLTPGVTTHGFQLLSVQRHPDPQQEFVTVMINQRHVQIGYHPDFIHSRISRYRHLPNLERNTESSTRPTTETP